MNKFNPDDLKNPLYEYSQVITTNDLSIIYLGLAEQYKSSKWWEIRHRYNLSVAGHTIYELLSWINDNKPALKGAKNENRN